MLKEFVKEAVVTMAPVPRISILTLVMGLRECNMNPIQVRYLAALHPDTPYTSTRAQQIATPNESYGSSPNFSYGKPSLKLYPLKLGRRPPATSNFSYSYHPYPTKSYLTSGTSVVSELMVTSLMLDPKEAS